MRIRHQRLAAVAIAVAFAAAVSLAAPAGDLGGFMVVHPAGATAADPLRMEIQVSSAGWNGSKDLVVSATVGQPVELVFVWADHAEPDNTHIVAIPELGLSTPLLTRDAPTATLAFTPAQSGTFTIKCAEPCEGHKTNLQTGRLEVADAPAAPAPAPSEPAPTAPAPAPSPTGDPPPPPPAGAQTAPTPPPSGDAQETPPLDAAAPESTTPAPSVAASDGPVAGADTGLLAPSIRTRLTTGDRPVLRTTVRDADGQPVPKATVTVSVVVRLGDVSGAMVVGSGVTDADGVALIPHAGRWTARDHEMVIGVSGATLPALERRMSFEAIAATTHLEKDGLGSITGPLRFTLLAVALAVWSWLLLAVSQVIGIRQAGRRQVRSARAPAT